MAKIYDQNFVDNALRKLETNAFNFDKTAGEVGCSAASLYNWVSAKTEPGQSLPFKKKTKRMYTPEEKKAALDAIKDNNYDLYKTSQKTGIPFATLASWNSPLGRFKKTELSPKDITSTKLPRENSSIIKEQDTKIRFYKDQLTLMRKYLQELGFDMPTTF